VKIPVGAEDADDCKAAIHKCRRDPPGESGIFQKGKIMASYDMQMRRFAAAFVTGSTLCAVDCQCGRIHFTSARGHGTYDEGELEGLQMSARKHPDKYIEHADYDHVDYCHCFDMVIVPECPCGKAAMIARTLEGDYTGIAKYIGLYVKDLRTVAEMEEGDNRSAMDSIAEVEA
jgi:hypothetical protein